jgi:hypothetical protein
MVKRLLAVSWFAGGLLTAVAQVTVPMSQYDFGRTGASPHERILKPANVNSAQFGKLFSRRLDDTVYALPLIVSDLEIHGARRNVMFVATMSNTVYAFDADNPSKSEPYWSRNIGTPAPGSKWIGPVNHGVLGTPCIDARTGTLYVVAMVKTQTETNFLVHAMDIRTGSPKYNSPQLISFPFKGGPTLSNVPGALQRSGLLVVNDVLYVAFANIVPPGADPHWAQEGFVQSFRARDLSQRLGVFQSTPNGEKGGVWQGARGIATDGTNIYIATAGGTYDGLTDYGTSVVKLSARRLKVLDWFTPHNHRELFLKNIDLSAGGVTLIPNSRFLFAGGKEGVIYLIDRNKLGRLEGSSGTPLQRFKASEGCGLTDCAQTLATAFWARDSDGVLYVWDRGDHLRAYRFVNDRFAPAASSTSKQKHPVTGGPSVSSNGGDMASGIVWAVTTTVSDGGVQAPGTLRAFLATDVSQEIYNSDASAGQDALGNITKFAPPVVANGKVYVPTHSNEVAVYGLKCAQDISHQVSSARGALVPAFNGTYSQAVTIKNTSRFAIGGPFELALDNLTPGVGLTNATGSTSCLAPAGSPAIRASHAPLWLPPGGTFAVTLRFSAHSGSIDFGVRALSGFTTR